MGLSVKSIGWIAMKFGTHIHVPLRMNCNHFGDPLSLVKDFWGLVG